MVGGPCDYCVSPSPKNWVFGFFRFGLNLGSGFGACWDRGLGLTINDEFITLLLESFFFCAASYQFRGHLIGTLHLAGALFLCWWTLKLPRSKEPPYMSRYPVTLSLTNQRPLSWSRELYWPMRGHAWHIGHGHTSPRIITRLCYCGGGSGEAHTSAPLLRDLDFCNQV